jgi:hypothetical protein
LLFRKGCQVTPPRLGDVEDVGLTVSHRRSTETKKVAPESDEDDEPGLIEQPTGQDSGSSAAVAQLVRAQQAISRLSVPLWIIVILLVLELFT